VLRCGLQHARELVRAGYLLTYRYDPQSVAAGKNPMELDSQKPDFVMASLITGEIRFALAEICPKETEKTHPQLVEDLEQLCELRRESPSLQRDCRWGALGASAAQKDFPSDSSRCVNPASP
jgi:hypothetical protein